jgi:PTH1 family peptidyl-tRNA hydrolase
VGFRIVDRWVETHGGTAWRDKFEGLVSAVNCDSGERVVALKPMTFMNLSGHSVRAAMGFFKIDPAHLILIHDELDLPFGDCRLKLGGSAAGHNGVSSVIEQLGTDDFARLRFGIGRAPAEFGGSGADFVLDSFPLADRPQLEELVEACCKTLDYVVKDGLSAAMNRANRRKK